MPEYRARVWHRGKFVVRLHSPDLAFVRREGWRHVSQYDDGHPIALFIEEKRDGRWRKVGGNDDAMRAFYADVAASVGKPLLNGWRNLSTVVTEGDSVTEGQTPHTFSLQFQRPWPSDIEMRLARAARSAWAEESDDVAND
jgi:hypothetical protein